MVIKDAHFKKVADGVKPDAKKRVVLRSISIDEGVSYHIYINIYGQIVLDPQISIPASEAWLFNNPAAMESLKRGMDDAANGRITKVDLDTL